MWHATGLCATAYFSNNILNTANETLSQMSDPLIRMGVPSNYTLALACYSGTDSSYDTFLDLYLSSLARHTFMRGTVTVVLRACHTWRRASHEA